MIPGIDAINLIKQHEGLCLTTYRCPAQVLTIGFGHTRTAKLGMTITELRAEQLLKDDLEICAMTIEKEVRVPLTQTQFDALCSFIFNVGVGAFRSSTLLRKLNASDYQGASKEFLRWTKGGGKELPGLVKRRKAEQAIFNKQ